uniref:Uncharacterized protein n=1 Tax=Arion vulgaris TaxID=1028688 RepID=A0A0B6ZLR5_9EUPU
MCLLNVEITTRSQTHKDNYTLRNTQITTHSQIHRHNYTLSNTQRLHTLKHTQR